MVRYCKRCRGQLDPNGDHVGGKLGTFKADAYGCLTELPSRALRQPPRWVLQPDLPGMWVSILEEGVIVRTYEEDDLPTDLPPGLHCGPLPMPPPWLEEQVPWLS